MVMEVKIEKLKPEEVEIFWPVFSQVLKNDFPGYSLAVLDFFLNQVYTSSAFSYWLSQEEKTVLVAKIKEQIVGFAVLDRPYGGVCFCRWLGVLAKFQKQGIGKKLVDSWINYAQDYGCHKIEISSQPQAKDFYHKYGLELEGKRKLSYFGIDLYIFGKILDQPREEIMIKP